jgi:outer membrane receptor protein involved in Fe transport
MSILSKKAALYCGAAAVALSCTSGAGAQQAAPTGVQNGGSIETVIVTASRRSETVQNVAGQVTALTGTELEQMHANSFADFANSVPGLSFASGGATSNLIAIRGVTTGTTQLGSAVGLYLDDVPLGASTQFGLGFQAFNVNLFDLDRIEVLNGPQGTLFGANALGGVVRYITDKPDPDGYDARLEVEGSDTDHGSFNDGLRVMADMPLLDGTAAIRIDGLQEYDSGYTQDPTHDRTNVGSGRTLSGRISFLWKPTSDVDVRISAYSQNIVGSGADVSLRDPVTHQQVIGAYDQSYALSQPSESFIDLYSAVVDWDLHWAKLTSITGYQIDHGQYTSDLSTFYDTAFGLYDYLAPFYGSTIFDDFLNPYALTVDDLTTKVTQEVRLSSPDNKFFEWVIGGYFDHETTDESVDLLDEGTTNGTIPAPFTGVGTLPFFGYLPSTYRELAAYADGTYFVTDNFDVTLGIRYSNQVQNYQSNIQSVVVPNAFFPTPNTLYHYQSGSNGGEATYLINPRWHITDDVMVYAKVSSGYRPGGPNFELPNDALPATFQPDTLWNYEVGEKSTFWDGRATLDADVYDIQWNDMQATENVEGINQLVNCCDARIEGAEASFNYRVLPDLSVAGSGAYTDAVTTTNGAALDVAPGVRLPLSPKFNFALQATYNYDLGGGIGGAVNVSDVYVGNRGEGFAGSELDPLYTLPAYNTVNLNLAFYFPHSMEVDAYVKNIFDTEGQVSASTLNNALITDAPVPVYLSQPRTIGVVLKWGLN